MAVLGVDADPRPLGELMGVDQLTLARLIDELSTSEIMMPGKRLDFVHPIVRTAIYGELAAGERAARHAAAAAALREGGATPDRVGVHLLLSEPGSVEGAADTLLAAGIEARSRGAPEVAIRFLERALDEPVDERSRAAILHELGVARIVNGDPAAVALENFGSALELADDPNLRAERALTAARGVAGIHPDRAVQIVQMALEQTGTIHSALEARLLSEAVVGRTYSSTVAFAQACFATRWPARLRSSGRASTARGSRWIKHVLAS